MKLRKYLPLPSVIKRLSEGWAYVIEPPLEYIDLEVKTDEKKKVKTDATRNHHNTD